MASSSISMLQLASIGGNGRQAIIHEGLEGIEFTAKCPPDVQKDTRIVAVCGIPGFRAAPQDDGWFFSDFFLFYQMLGSRPELPNQLWLSSCSPSDLIHKHERYLHGPANGIAGDRRVVMDEKMLPKDEIRAGFRVFEPRDLLEIFLATLESEIEEAARINQPVLILIFGHGEENTSGISIGCCEGGHLKLTQPRLASVLKKEVQTTLILTSCYSGGWIMMPNSNEYFDMKPALNRSFLTTVLSQTTGRQAGGSIFATCLLHSIITASGRTNNIYSGDKVYDNQFNDRGEHSRDMQGKLFRVQEDDEGEDISLSMAGLIQQIRRECEARYGSLWGNHNFSFAAQDDRWAQTWGKRTGLPVLNYMEKWESLPEAPPTKNIYPPAGPLAGSIASRSPGALHNIVKVKARRYMESMPGPDNAGCNTNCHPRFYRLIEGARFELDELYRLNEILDYRQGQIALAEIYCYALEIGVPEGQQVDQFHEVEWESSHLKEKHGRSEERSRFAIDLLERFYTIRRWVIQLEIFDPPRDQQGFGYPKPKTYLAARLAESPITTQQIHKILTDLLQYKLEAARYAARSPLGVAVLNQPEIKTTRGRLYNTVSKLKHRLRSLSPRKISPSKEVEDQEQSTS